MAVALADIVHFIEYHYENGSDASKTHPQHLRCSQGRENQLILHNSNKGSSYHAVASSTAHTNKKKTIHSLSQSGCLLFLVTVVLCHSAGFPCSTMQSVTHAKGATGPCGWGR